MPNKEYRMSREHLEDLKSELHYLKTVREMEVAEKIKIARGFGDLSENNEYDEAKNEQAQVYARIRELEQMIPAVVVIEPEKIKTDKVATGCKVTVKDLEFKETETYTLVGSQEANPMEMRISDESPFGLALIGKKVGQTCEINAPAGKITYKIMKIDV